MSKATTATIQKSSDLELLTQSLEKLTQQEAITQMRELHLQGGLNDFKLGGVLCVIYENKYWKGTAHANFKDFVTEELGVNYFKATYLIRIYRVMVECSISLEKVTSIGWSKMKELLEVIKPDNVDHWLKLASESTVVQLRAMVEASKASFAKGPADDEGESKPKSNVTSITFKVHEDQKDIIQSAIDTAKHIQETEFDNVALEAVCLSFLAAPAEAVVAEVDLAAEFRKLGPIEVLTLFDTIWPEYEVSLNKPMEEENTNTFSDEFN